MAAHFYYFSGGIKLHKGYCITHWFQPIYRLEDNSIIGYEALLRDASQSQVSPVDIFAEAEKKGQLNALDLISIKTAMDTIKNESNTLFLNVFPSTLLDKSFLNWWDIHASHRMPIVLELLENESVQNWEALKKVTEELKARGIKIAVDDMGGGYSFFQQWIELEPDYIKLDRYFAENLSTSLRKQKTVNSLVELLAGTTETIIEGIERKEDLDTAIRLGVTCAQGYLLGKPSPWK